MARTISTVTVWTGAAAQRAPRKPGRATMLTTTALAHARATIRRLSGSTLTVAGLTCVDVGAFQAHPIAGWLTTGATILVLDWKIE